MTTLRGPVKEFVVNIHHKEQQLLALTARVRKVAARCAHRIRPCARCGARSNTKRPRERKHTAKSGSQVIFNVCKKTLLSVREKPKNKDNVPGADDEESAFPEKLVGDAT